MKKTVSLIVTLLTAVLCFTGCFSSGESISVLSDKPWDNNNGYEYISYAVEKAMVENGEVAGNEAEGQFTTVLYEINENIYDSDLITDLNGHTYFKDNFSACLMKTPGAYTILKTDFSLTYLTGEHTGKTDTMSSVVLFKSVSLSPVFSEKTVSNETNGISYTAVADYNAMKNIFTSGDNTTETEIKGTYDNEMLTYVVRGRSGLTSGSSESLSINNAVYSGVYGTSDARTIYANVSSSEYYCYGLDPDKNGFIGNYFTEGSIDYYEEATQDESTGLNFTKGYALKCRAVGLTLNATSSGPSSIIYYSQPSFSSLGQITSSVPVQINQYEYNAETQAVSYMYTYKINDYKTSQLL